MGANNINSQIVEQMKKEIRRKKLSLRDLSKISMVSPSTIYDVLENKCSPRLSTVQDICKALNLEIKLYKKGAYTEPDELIEVISNLSKKKRETLKEIILLLNEYNE